MAVIKVPKTPKTAFNKHRRPSSLLLSQIEHLEWAALPASQRKPHLLPKQKVKTEGQAAERIGQLTSLVLAPKVAVNAATATPVKLPPLPPPTAPPPQGRSARKVAAARGRKPGAKTATTAAKTPRRRAGSRRTRG